LPPARVNPGYAIREVSVAGIPVKILLEEARNLKDPTTSVSDTLFLA